MMIVIGSRSSDLALWQARFVQTLLQQEAGLATEIQVIRTTGDRDTNTSLAALPGQGFFTKEIEEALLRGEIDLAVHSHKDLPTDSHPGLRIAAVPERGDPAECLLVRPEAWSDEGAVPLKSGAVVGTGSARRRAQLLALRTDLEVRDLRGNVPTRLRRAKEGEMDAIVLAKAGLTRLALDPTPLRVREFPPAQFVPAPAQGALALQVRAETARREPDRTLVSALALIHHEPTARQVCTERLLLAALVGGCNLPLGAYATDSEDGLRMIAMLGDTDGTLRHCDVQGKTPDQVARTALIRLTDQID